jgi:molecular chaperone HtpG
MFKDANLDAIICDTLIDSHFLSYLEYKQPKSLRFVRIDADIDGALKAGEVAEEDGKEIVELFKTKLEGRGVSVKAERLKSGAIPAVVYVEEFMRRMSEMQNMYGVENMPEMQNTTLVLNLTNPVVSGIMAQTSEKQELLIKQIYYLAMLSYKKLTPEELSEFVECSSEILFELTK